MVLVVVVLKGTLVFCFGPKYWFETEDLAQAEQFYLLFITCSLKSQLVLYLWSKSTIPVGGWTDGSTGTNTNSTQLSWSWGWGWAWQKTKPISSPCWDVVLSFFVLSGPPSIVSVEKWLSSHKWLQFCLTLILNCTDLSWVVIGNGVIYVLKLHSWPWLMIQD